jgi:magnesium transporter
MTTQAVSKAQRQLLHQLSFYPERRLELFRGLTDEEKVDIIFLLDRRTRQALLTQLPDEELIHFLELMDPDDTTDILQSIHARRREKILSEVSQELQDSVVTLLQFDPETAAGLMTLDYIQVDFTDTVSDVSKKFKLHEKRTGRPPVILAMREGRLAGYLPGHELGFAARTEKIGKYVKKIQTVNHADEHDKVIQTFKAHPHGKVAVLNDDNSVLGIIYSDDVLKLLHEQDSTSLYDFAGVSEEETVTDSAKRKIKLRYKWLIINLATAFLAAFTVGRFEDVLSKFVLLAVYMPIVAGMGGNAATQTLAVMVRGIALRQIELKTAFRTLRNELGSGLANGIINGLLVAGVVLIFNGDVKIAAILAIAMVLNLLVAAFFGTLVPLVMSKLGKDPAASATIFITTATDVLGFMAFLGLATLILL